ncbi:hypothetical protein LPB140_01780 [Sphingorhabdus lutea]|uniref:Endonuclease/exonuclease/phosphatase domain-containing protein n=1 Tax=Sphingorhabdus lutea TaxID=1913578 RepID=A0A1L3J9G3_9SPHN|nr:endonuclease/exonuclease/phosphatase family protein [Sphingorhabdus lutea]APG61767.1 hypothetical protein LPB140_01780 [Sphingorhabdus lutea]
MTLSLRVTSYNIHKAVGTDGRYDPARIMDILHIVDADIVALQESDRRFGNRHSCLPLDMIENNQKWQIVDFKGKHEKKVHHGIGWHGNALFIPKQAKIIHSETIKLPTLEPRGAICAHIEIGGQHLCIISCHLDLSGLWRRRQIRTILEYIDKHPHKLPTILMGDFNQWSRSGALSEFAYHHLKLVDMGPSFPSRRPVARLDRLLHSPDIIISNHGVCDDAKARQASDHLPIWADVQI